MVQGHSGDGGQYWLGEYLATVTSTDIATTVVALFTAFLAPSPEGFSGYFAPSSRGWEEARENLCELGAFRLPDDGGHLFLLFWQTDSPSAFTQRHINQWSRAWTRVFDDAKLLEPGELGHALAQGIAVSPNELGLHEENAGARREAVETTAAPRRRRWFS
jgi:hypothetical protein